MARHPGTPRRRRRRRRTRQSSSRGAHQRCTRLAVADVAPSVESEDAPVRLDVGHHLEGARVGTPNAATTRYLCSTTAPPPLPPPLLSVAPSAPASAMSPLLPPPAPVELLRKRSLCACPSFPPSQRLQRARLQPSPSPAAAGRLRGIRGGITDERRSLPLLSWGVDAERGRC